MSNLNFKLYVGGKGITVDRTGLEAVHTPDASGRWQPISHISLVNEFEKALTPLNMRISNETFKLDKAGSRMFGMLQVSNCKTDADFSFMVGLRNSHDKLLRAGLSVGMGVMVCSNLSFRGEIVIGRKHTINIMNDLPLLMIGAIGKLAQKWDTQGKIVQQYKNTGISRNEAYDILVQCAKSEVFPRTQLLDVIEEFETPRHEEFKPRNMWSLFNSVTEWLKPRENSTGGTLWLLPSRTERLHAICDAIAGVAPLAADETFVEV